MHKKAVFEVKNGRIKHRCKTLKMQKIPLLQGISAKKEYDQNCIILVVLSWRRVRDSNPRFLVGTQHFEFFAPILLYRLFHICFRMFYPQKIRVNQGLLA